MLTLAQIVDANDRETRVIAVPEWGGEVRIRELSFDAKSKIFAASKNANGELDHARLALLLLVHGIAEPAITEADAEKLRDKSGRVIERLVAAIGELNKMGEGASATTEAAFLPGDAVARGAG